MQECKPLQIPDGIHVHIMLGNLKDYVGLPVYHKDRMYVALPPPGVNQCLSRILGQWVGYCHACRGYCPFIFYAQMQIMLTDLLQSMPGKGGLQLTGKLGEVIRESVQIGLSWVKAHAYELGITKMPNKQFLMDLMIMGENITEIIYLPADHVLSISEEYDFAYLVASGIDKAVSLSSRMIRKHINRRDEQRNFLQQYVMEWKEKQSTKGGTKELADIVWNPSRTNGRMHLHLRTRPKNVPTVAASPVKADHSLIVPAQETQTNGVMVAAEDTDGVDNPGIVGQLLQDALLQAALQNNALPKAVLQKAVLPNDAPPKAALRNDALPPVKAALQNDALPCESYKSFRVDLYQVDMLTQNCARGCKRLRYTSSILRV
ncbi:hypothetical protein DFH29DRAFT_1022601 [Suillus ampliporus]|nr:hypothetical protein DFH29DRAFT_1022601 [Suillus ampliporus]